MFESRRARLRLALILAVLAAAPASADDSSSLAAWLGARGGAVLPGAGNLGTQGWPRLLGPGGSLELDAGLRFDRCNVVYGFGEWSAFAPGPGSPDGIDVGHIATVFARPSGGTGWSAGVGLQGIRGLGRWRVLGDLAVLYRQLTARWEDGSSVTMNGWLDLRLGAGAELRFTDSFATSALLTLVIPAFTSTGEALFADGSGSALPSWARLPFVVGIQVGAHFDIPGANACGDCFLRLQNP